MRARPLEHLESVESLLPGIVSESPTLTFFCPHLEEAKVLTILRPDRVRVSSLTTGDSYCLSSQRTGLVVLTTESPDDGFLRHFGVCVRYTRKHEGYESHRASDD